MPQRSGRIRGRRRVAAALLACSLALTSVSPALADDFESKRAGHPLRIVAYILHPFGVLIEYLILRPAHWIGSKEPVKTAVGHEDEG